jgi:energy-coupling factor transport system ATP-binding protein
MIIELERIWFSYDGLLPEQRPALREVSFSIRRGEFVGLVGPSGSGKTTLMLHLTGLLKPQRGKVLVDGVDVNAPGVDLVCLRRRIGLVFQFPETQLFEETVWEDVAFGPRNLGLPPEEVAKRVRQALERVGLDPERFGARNPHQLSEGERRRVALAGVVAMEPEVLVLDEPTAGLDPQGVRLLEQFLRKFHSGGGTVVLISHHLDFVARSCSRIVALHRGQVVFDGPRDAFFADETLLREMGLRLPRLLHWWCTKRLRHPQLPPQVYSLEEVRRVLAEIGHRDRQRAEAGRSALPLPGDAPEAQSRTAE